jgi:hypothetical protein
MPDDCVQHIRRKQLQRDFEGEDIKNDPAHPQELRCLLFSKIFKRDLMRLQVEQLEERNTTSLNNISFHYV